ncbi:uncharacterized protein LOC119093634 [Pollicipes pollicipes]|uniref:uncharacterized protein LOC119093634 n=1 Tax=Pollicipes pollicipes TaxID=41117 RepID=UPI00188560F8|nr:uncharacterized protein LOC119093634 [Pollicipes pollicipes]
MRLLAALGLLALARQVSAEATANPLISQQIPRSAKMGDQRAEYYAQKYANHPRAGAAGFVKDQGSKSSSPIPVYTEAPSRIETDYSPYLEDGAETATSVRGNETARFFGLSTTNQDLQLGLHFTVPFLSVPLGSLLGQYTDWSSLLQVNWPSLVALGVVLLAAVVIIPWLASKVSGGNLPSYLNLSNYGRADDGGDAEAPTLMARLDEALQKYDIDSTACMQRGVCTYVREAATSVKEGRAGSKDLILDGIASNSYINSWLDGTSLQEATKAGRSGANCATTYAKCPLTANSVYRALAKYIGNAV